MLVASFVAGCIPLATKLSETKLNTLTFISVGLLISTSLVVIIPEGVETLYTNKAPETIDAPGEAKHLHLADHTAVGLSLLVGFAVMFIIDHISTMHVHPTNTASEPANFKSRNSLELDAMLAPTSNASSSSPDTTTAPHTHDLTTPTIGLIVHAAADGIALGASASHPQLSIVVFFAIMLHKAPSAFALTTVLLSEGLSRTRVRQHLLMFSLSAPTGAISTYALLHFFSESVLTVNLEYWTGVLLLFSGGTFLYVAMHAIHELPSNKGDYWQMGSILLGMLIPFVLNMNHSH
ncbi:Zinc transporter ZIP9 [Choanephora cucurbitarum]|uniref:Zinc transporter ZIP9 n=1 Tax=Choanephora cucurbitarum TaxID=101091 RepID=A0A1C7NK11_9FUNG|nr:Zinc transporter ZIP9 [Choanephora cucurbitarum]